METEIARYFVVSVKRDGTRLKTASAFVDWQTAQAHAKQASQSKDFAGAVIGDILSGYTNFVTSAPVVD